MSLILSSNYRIIYLFDSLKTLSKITHFLLFSYFCPVFEIFMVRWGNLRVCELCDRIIYKVWFFSSMYQSFPVLCIKAHKALNKYSKIKSCNIGRTMSKIFLPKLCILKHDRINTLIHIMNQCYTFSVTLAFTIILNIIFLFQDDLPCLSNSRV